MSLIKGITVEDIGLFLRNIINLLQRPIWMNAQTGAVRLVDTVATVTTVSACNNVAAIGIQPSQELSFQQMKHSYFLSVRSRIS